MNSEKNNIINILKNKINKQLNLHVTDKNTIKHFSKYVDSLADDKQSLKTFNSHLSNIKKYNINNISGGKLLKKIKGHTNTYDLEVTMYVNRSYKQRDNTWSPMKLEVEPIVYSRPVYAGSYTEAVNLIKVEAESQGQCNDTWYNSQVSSISISSGVNTSSISAHSPSDMFMRDSTPLQYVYAIYKKIK